MFYRPKRYRPDTLTERNSEIVSRTYSRVLASLRRGLYVQCIGEVDDVVTEAALLGDVQQISFHVYLWQRCDMPEMLETESELWRGAERNVQ